MAVLDGIYEIRNRVANGRIEVTIGTDAKGRARIAFSGDTYDIKETLKKEFHTVWDRDSKSWVLVHDGNTWWMRDGREAHDPDMVEYLGMVIPESGEPEQAEVETATDTDEPADEPAALPADAESIRAAMVAKLEGEIARIESEPVEPRPDRKFRGFTLKGATADEVRAERDERIDRIESDIAALMSFADSRWFTDNAAYAGDGWGVPPLSKRIRAHAEYIASKKTR